MNTNMESGRAMVEVGLNVKLRAIASKPSSIKGFNLSAARKTGIRARLVNAEAMIEVVNFVI